MNNAWSIALRLPCHGLRTNRTPSQLGCQTIKAGFLCRTSVVTHERSQILGRGFTTSSWQLAKKKLASKKEILDRMNASQRARQAAPPPSPRASPQTKNAKVPGSQVKKAEKAQVQLSEAQVAGILGSGLTFDQGMDLLQELQFRRVTGSLSDKGIEFPEREEYTQDHRMRALEWLREEYPVDEEAAAAEYAEELAEAERKELEQRARRLRIYKKDENAKEEEDDKEEDIYIDEDYDKTPLKADQTRDITSGSALAARKEYIEASRKKAKIEAEKVAEEMEARGEKPPEPYRGHDLVVAKKTSLEDTRKIKHDHWEKLKEEAELDVNEVTAERSAFSRLWAPITFGLAVAALSWIYADGYEPPKSSMRVFPTISPATATIVTIAAANLMMFVMWRHPNAWKFMNRNFLLSPGVPRAFSVVGALFSHQQFNHWMWNMAALYVVGQLVHEEVGRGQFLSLYLTSGITGYLLSLSFNVLSKAYLSATLGASAAVFGLVGAYFTLAPTRNLKRPEFLGGDLEFRAWIPLVLMIGWEFFRWRVNLGVIDGVSGGSDHITHLGGMIAGALYGYIIRRRLEEERRQDNEPVVQAPSDALTPLSVSTPASSTK